MGSLQFITSTSLAGLGASQAYVQASANYIYVMWIDSATYTYTKIRAFSFDGNAYTLSGTLDLSPSQISWFHVRSDSKIAVVLTTGQVRDYSFTGSTFNLNATGSTTAPVGRTRCVHADVGLVVTRQLFTGDLRIWNSGLTAYNRVLTAPPSGEYALGADLSDFLYVSTGNSFRVYSSPVYTPSGPGTSLLSSVAYTAGHNLDSVRVLAPGVIAAVGQVNYGEGAVRLFSYDAGVLTSLTTLTGPYPFPFYVWDASADYTGEVAPEGRYFLACGSAGLMAYQYSGGLGGTWELLDTALDGDYFGTVVVDGVIHAVSDTHLYAYGFSLPAPTATVRIVAEPKVGVSPLVVRFSAKVLLGEYTSFAWDFGDGSTSYGPEVEHAYTSVGYHTVELTAFDSNGSSTMVVERGLVRVGKFSFAVEYDSVATPPVSAQFTNTSVAPTGYEFVDWRWTFGDMSLGSGLTGPSHVYGSYGNYNVSLTAKLQQVG